MNKTLEQLAADLTPEKRAALYQKLLQKRSPQSDQLAIVRQLSAEQDQGLPLSFSQQRMWFLEQLEPEKAWYNISRIFWFDSNLDTAALQKSLASLTERHEALRTTFKLVDSQPLQFVAPTADITWEVVDLRRLEPGAGETAVRQRARIEARRPFNLVRGPLLRPFLFQLTDQRHALLLTLHHLITDGWSMDILLQELDAFYQAHKEGKTADIPALPIRYADYAVWQRRQEQSSHLEKQLDYWQEQLGGDLPILQLPTDYPRPPIQSFNGAIQTHILPRALTDRLQVLSQQENVTLFMILLAAYYVLLYRYSGQEDILVGTPIAGRTRREVEGLVGLFINTLVLRADLSNATAFRQLLQQVRQTTLEAYSHQELPFERLVEKLAPERPMSHTPVFQAFFGLQNSQRLTTQSTALPLDSMEVVDKSIANFDLLFSIDTPANNEDGLTILAQYSADLFEADTIERLLGHYQTILESVANNPDQELGQITLLSAAERQQLLESWPHNQTAYPLQCIHQLFEAEACLHPTATALIFEETQVSYAELNKQANQLAHYLRRLGVGPEVLVTLFMERSIEMIVATLAILKAGGAYLPLDTGYPPDRLAFMLADSNSPVLLTQKKLQERLPEGAASVICLDKQWPIIAQESEENPTNLNQLDDLAYVMYTSGSTGRPKGVSVAHRSVIRLVKHTDYAHFSAEEVFLQFAPASFDAATFEIWGSLLNGARLVIFPPYSPSLVELGTTLRRYGVTTLWLTAGLFHLMIDEQIEDLKGLRQLLAGGDVLSVPHIQKALHQLPDCQLINGYGPTEGTTFSACYPITKESRLDLSIPIGRPIANTQTYILDDYLQPVPVGVPGKLYIGGDGLARNYLNRPSLTAERFIPHPFGLEPGARLYITGDLARYRPDGTIEFLGRSDFQVKVRGFRIELGEIEIALSQHSAVQDVIVVARNDWGNDKRLVAYVVAKEPWPALSAELRQFLTRKLPGYMIPHYFIEMDALPLNPNGKVDRHRLPAPPENASSLESGQYIGVDQDGRTTNTPLIILPRTPTEKTIADIWAESLGLEQIGIHHNFFEMGGHSLLAIKAIARIYQEMQIDVPVRTLFEWPTVAGFAQAVKDLEDIQTSATPAMISLIETEEGAL